MEPEGASLLVTLLVAWLVWVIPTLCKTGLLVFWGKFDFTGLDSSVSGTKAGMAFCSPETTSVAAVIPPLDLPQFLSCWAQNSSSFSTFRFMSVDLAAS